MEPAVRILNARSKRVDPATITLYPDNPREGDVGALAVGYQKIGFYGAVCVDERTGICLVGNHRIKAALALGMKKIPVTYLKTDDDEHARAIMLTDNRISDLASNNEALLIIHLQASADAGRLAGTGYDNDDRDALIAALESSGPIDLDGGAAGINGAPASGEGHDVSHVRMVQLFLDDDTHAPFIEACERLAVEFGKDNVTDTVLAAIERGSKEWLDA